MVDWAKVEQSYSFSYAPDGKYNVKADKVEIKEVGTNNTPIMKFHFEGRDGLQFPTVDHWLSFNNENWRAWHSKCLMEAFGATEENAKKAVEVCESKKDKASIEKAYEQTFNRLLAKKPEVEIEVYTQPSKTGDKEYARAEFVDRRIAMPKDDGSTTANTGEGDWAPQSMEEAEEISPDDIPF